MPWALSIARGIAHVHKHKCVHRDLAARNVFINDKLEAIVGDLGLAWPLPEGETLLKSKRQWKQYPVDEPTEVLQKHEYSTASDIFSFGLTLFQIATECKVEDAFSIDQLTTCSHIDKLNKLAARGYSELLAKLPATVDPEIKALMVRCLAKESVDRPSAEQIVTELEALMKKQAPQP